MCKELKEWLLSTTPNKPTKKKSFEDNDRQRGEQVMNSYKDGLLDAFATDLTFSPTY